MSVRALLLVALVSLASCTAGEVFEAPVDASADAPRADVTVADIARPSDAPRDTSATDAPIADTGPGCAALLCPLHATCTAASGTARCLCDMGFHLQGTACVADAPVDLCLGVTCSGHGRCAVQASMPSCVCDAGYRAMGLACVAASAPDACAGVTCSGHGTCVTAGGNAGCVCERGYRATGLSCVPDVAPDPCDGVTCSGHGRCVNTAGSVTCACDAGWRPSGRACVPDAMPDPCVGVTCSGHGRCVASGTAATCACDTGWRPSGTSCVADTPMDPCAGVTCSGHGRCVSSAGAAACNCDAGWRASGLTCVSSSAPDPCATVDCGGHGRCLVADGAPVCHCDDGYANRIVATNCQPSAGTVCEGVACGSGTCLIMIVGGACASCSCDPGYVPYGAACVPERRIFCRDASGMRQPRGTTRCGSDESAVEVCRDADGDGFVEWAFGVRCNAGTTCSGGCRTARCPDQACPLGTACLVSTHGIDVGVCVTSCACTRCGNCALSDFAASGSVQAYCGNRAGAPATTACEAPCPSPGDGCIPYDPALCYPIEGCFSGPPR